MNKYGLYLILTGLILILIVLFIVRSGLKSGTFYLMGAPVTRKDNAVQFWMIIIFHSLTIGGIGLSLTYFGLFKK